MSSMKKTIAGVLPEGLKAAIRSLRPETPDKASNVAIGTFGGFEVAYRRATADEEVIKHSFDQDIFFKSVPEYRPTGSDVIVDVGAHIGTFALLAASKAPRGRVFAIEASLDTFNFLRINVALNRAENIAVHHLALTDKNGPVTLYHDTGNWGHSVVADLSKVTETVEGVSLASFMERARIDRVQFMKLNCEGAEFPLLLAAPTALLERFDMVLVLYHADLWTKHTAQDLVTHLQASGLTCKVSQQTEKRGWILATRTR
jgi:FkbM family methyltransferase